jgi:hypothetical protein
MLSFCIWPTWSLQGVLSGVGFTRREIITVRGQSYVWRLPKYWPPTLLSARRVGTPCLCCGRKTHSPGGEGGGGSIFWKTQDTALFSTYIESSLDLPDRVWWKWISDVQKRLIYSFFLISLGRIRLSGFFSKFLNKDDLCFLRVERYRKV